MNFQHPAWNRAAASAMCVASGFRRAEPAPTGGFMNRDPRIELSRELAAQQTLIDQLHALAADDF
jgi:hypothetical protein